jgi:hypothetical protein
MGEKGITYDVFVGNSERNWENLDVDGGIMIKCILKKYEYTGRIWTGFIWLRIRTSDGLL